MESRARRQIALSLTIVAAVAAGALPALGQDAPPRATAFRQPVRICSGGDVTLGTNLIPVWANRAADSLRRHFGMDPHPDSLLRQLRPMLTGADIVLLNIEAAIGSGPAQSKCGPTSTNCFAFRQDPPAAAALGRLGEDGTRIVGNVANNHSRDAGIPGLLTTLGYLRAAGVAVTGADTLGTPVATQAGDTIAFLGFHASTETPDVRDLAAVRRHVARAVRAYGTVVVTMHLGAEGITAQRTRNVTETYLGENRGNPVAFANAAFGAGATLIVGHGPHVLRAAEWRGTRLAFYSLGNLLTYGPFRLREPANYGAVACATIEGPGRVVDAELRATIQAAPGVLRPDPSGRAYAIVDSLSRLDFPATGATVSRSGALGTRGR